jgi:hypothetical protein
VIGWPALAVDAGAIPIVAPSCATVACVTADQADRAEWNDALERMMLVRVPRTRSSNPDALLRPPTAACRA